MLVLVALVVALSSLSGVALAASKDEGGPRGGPAAETTIRRDETELEASRARGLTDFGRMEVRKSGELAPLREPAARAAEAAGAPQWIDGPFSSSTYFNVVTGTVGILTNEWVGYWGATDVSYPKTAELYYGRVVMANVGTQNAAVVPNVALPQGTAFDINPNDPTSGWAATPGTSRRGRPKS